MPNVEKPENIPEIQMPSLATLDPFHHLVDQDYTSINPKPTVLTDLPKRGQIYDIQLRMILC